MIDWQRVISLRDEIGEEDFAEIVPIFIEEATEITEKIRNSPTFRDLEDDLHCLKGSAVNLGFDEFADLCHKGETMAAKGAADSVDVVAILASFDASRLAFLQGLEDGAAWGTPKRFPEDR